MALEEEFKLEIPDKEGVVAILLLLDVALLCAYELCAVYVTAGSKASERYSPSGFCFGVSAIALAINMLFIYRMVSKEGSSPFTNIIVNNQTYLRREVHHLPILL